MSAIISPCGRYRFRLERTVDMTTPGKVFAYFGVNPSTADATVDDSTVRKWIGFTTVYGGSRFIVGNVFALRATDVRELKDLNALAAVRDENDRHIDQIAAEADVLVPCWGSRDKLPRVLRPWLDCTMTRLQNTGKPVMCFGLTASGDPKHPLILGYNTPLVAVKRPV